MAESATPAYIRARGWPDLERVASVEEPCLMTTVGQVEQAPDLRAGLPPYSVSTNAHPGCILLQIAVLIKFAFSFAFR